MKPALTVIEAKSQASPENGKSKELLDSWKEIAVFLNRGVRTVQRWEREEHLPIHRHHHKTRGSVWAFASEVSAWLNTRDREPHVPPTQLVTGGRAPEIASSQELRIPDDLLNELKIARLRTQSLLGSVRVHLEVLEHTVALARAARANAATLSGRTTTAEPPLGMSS